MSLSKCYSSLLDSMNAEIDLGDDMLRWLPFPECFLIPLLFSPQPVSNRDSKLETLRMRKNQPVRGHEGECSRQKK